MPAMGRLDPSRHQRPRLVMNDLGGRSDRLGRRLGHPLSTDCCLGSAAANGRGWGSGQTEYRCHTPGTPLAACSPRLLNCNPEPTTRSLTVLDTRTSPGWAAASTRAARWTASPTMYGSRHLDLARVNAGTQLKPERGRGVEDRLCRPDGAGRAVERREAAVADDLDKATPIPGGDLTFGVRWWSASRGLPLAVTQARREFCRADHVTEDDRGQHALVEVTGVTGRPVTNSSTRSSIAS